MNESLVIDIHCLICYYLDETQITDLSQRILHFIFIVLALRFCLLARFFYSCSDGDCDSTETHVREPQHTAGKVGLVFSQEYRLIERHDASNASHTGRNGLITDAMAGVEPGTFRLPCIE